MNDVLYPERGEGTLQILMAALEKYFAGICRTHHSSIHIGFPPPWVQGI